MPASGHTIRPAGQEITQKGGSMLKFKRAFAGRRKNKSQDFDIPLPNPVLDVAPSPRASSPRPGGGKFTVFTKRGLQSQSQLDVEDGRCSPPPPPPKEEYRDARRHAQCPQFDEFGQEELEEREDWRKSNSTTCTVKPQASPRPEQRRERDMSPHSSSSRSPSSVSSQLSSTGSSHTSMSMYPNPAPAPLLERRPTKRSLTSGLLPESLKGKRPTMKESTEPNVPHTAPPSSFRQQSPQPRHAWPPLYGPLDTQPSTQLPTKEQGRTNALSFTNSTLQFGKKAVGKMNFKGWGSTSAKSPSTVNHAAVADSSNSSASSLVQGTPSDTTAKNKYFSQMQTLNIQRGNHSAHSLASGSGSDAEAAQHSAYHKSVQLGPQLGVLVHPPRVPAGMGGMVFGRDLASATRDTRVISPEPVAYDASGRRTLEHRLMPALVVRCVIHLKKWGLDEEGIFRISGRQTHIQKLKAEFDSGADWDISGCSPAELDPHAVASVLRAYLRALPDPILTRSLGPQFDAVMSLEQATMDQQNSERSPGPFNRPGASLPLSPRAPPQIIRQPSLRDSVTLGGPRGPSPALIRSLAQLIAQLPPEHHDVLQTVTEVIRETARQSKATKMPLSNLLLIFCPSLNMPPTLLRLLSQYEEIWTAPLNEIVGPRLVRQRSASESMLLTHRKSSSAMASQHNRNSRISKTPSEGVSPSTEQLFVPEERAPTPDVDGVPESNTDATLIPLPSPVSAELELNGLKSELDEDFESPSRRHTVVAMTPSPEDNSWVAVDEASPMSSLVSLHPPISNPLGMSTISLSGESQTRHVPTVETTKEQELMLRLKQISDSESEFQRAHSVALPSPLEIPHPPIRHVVSLNLLRTRSKMDELQGPPSARSLPLEDRNHVRPRVTSKLRFSLRRRSNDLNTLIQDSIVDSGEVNMNSSLDTPPQLAPLMFDMISLTPGMSEDDIATAKLSGHLLNRLSMHSRSRSSPLLRESLIGRPDTFEWRNLERRTSNSIKYDRRLSSIRSLPYSTAPKLDLEPSSTADDDWLQSVLKAAANSTGDSS